MLEIRTFDKITVIQGMDQKISFLVDEIKNLKAMIRPLDTKNSVNTENPGSSLPHGMLKKTGNPEKFILNFEAWMAGKSGNSSVQ